jgi:hypothetical protein
MIRLALSAAALLALTACMSGPVQSANFDPMTCKVYAPKPGEPEFNTDQATNEAYKRDAAKAAAARAKENASKRGN